MYSVKKLSTDEEFKDTSEIVAYAYPGFKVNTEEDIEKLAESTKQTQEENPHINFYGVFNEDKAVGTMRLHDFNMNLMDTKIKTGGLGRVAVHFLHKKEKVAKEIVTYFINHYRDLGAPMVTLYPFRPDFYKNMGFGYGTSMNQYKVKPCNLPKGESKKNIHIVKEEGIAELLNCYDRAFEKTNGLIEKYEADFKMMFKNPKTKVAAYKSGNKIEGYMVYEFKNDEKNMLINDMVINDLVFENVEALKEIMTFLNSQSDQISFVIFNIQDEDFRFLLDDPRNDSHNMFAPVYHECSIQGTGIMYRVVNTRELFIQLKNHNFNNESLRVKLTIGDSFIEENDGSIIINFNDGFAELSYSDNFDVEIALDIADFSSLITCAVTFKSLYKYGRVTISNKEYIDKINNIFSSDDKPICLNRF